MGDNCPSHSLHEFTDTDSQNCQMIASIKSDINALGHISNDKTCLSLKAGKRGGGGGRVKTCGVVGSRSTHTAAALPLCTPLKVEMSQHVSLEITSSASCNNSISWSTNGSKTKEVFSMKTSQMKAVVLCFDHTSLNGRAAPLQKTLPTFSLLSCSDRGEVGDLTLPTATAWVTATPPPGAGLFSIVSTLISRCFGDTYLSEAATVFKLETKEMFPPGVYGSSKSSSFWSL